ncbi:hypothetical protein Peur_031259 [Populus x canadensis]
MYSAMEAQESCGRTWQFRIFLGSFLAVTVKTSPFLHGMHTKTFHLLPPCMDRDGVQPIRTIYNLQNISLANYSEGNKKKFERFHKRSHQGDDYLANQTDILPQERTLLVYEGRKAS